MKRTEKHLEGVAALLDLFATGSSRKEYLTAAVKLLRDWCGCECVGVRLRQDDGTLPYFAWVGFSRRFLRQECELSLETGECACLRVMAGRPRSEDAIWTGPYGLYYCNRTSRCADRLGPPGGPSRQIACIRAGYESVAQAPLRYRDELMGTLHMADTRPGRFPPATVGFIRTAVLLIAEAVRRLRVEESLVESEARFRSLFERHSSSMLLIDPIRRAIIDANPAAAAFYGYSRRRLRRMKLDELHHLPAKIVGHGWTRPFPGPRTPQVVLHRLANGETRAVEVHSSPVKIHGKHLRFSIIHDITQRNLLQKEVLEIGERERQRIGQDVHDSLGGKLTGAALMGKALAQKLGALGLPEAALAREVVQCINESIGQTRSLARGLYPVELSGTGLAAALAEFAVETDRRSGVRCHFEADPAVRIEQPFVALHLFRLALEAVNNALRHAHARNITIALTAAPTHLALEVRDDGKGLPENFSGNGGLGLRTMHYRAESMGGRLSLKSGPGGGTVVCCFLPRPSASRPEGGLRS